MMKCGRLVRSCLTVFFLFLVHSDIMSQNQNPPVPSDWLTHAERTDYRETPRYAETIEYAQRLDRASPLITFRSFGKSGEGRKDVTEETRQKDDDAFSPTAWRRDAIDSCYRFHKPSAKQ